MNRRSFFSGVLGLAAITAPKPVAPGVGSELLLNDLTPTGMAMKCFSAKTDPSGKQLEVTYVFTVADQDAFERCAARLGRSQSMKITSVPAVELPVLLDAC